MKLGRPAQASEEIGNGSGSEQADDQRGPHWSYRVGPLLALAVLVAVPPFAFGEHGTNVVNLAVVTAIVCVGLHVLVHWTGQVSLGHLAFVGVGGFVTAQVSSRYGMPLTVCIGAGAMGGGLAAAIVGLPTLRMRGFGVAITTLAFGVVAQAWLFRQEDLVGTSSGVPLHTSNLLWADASSSRSLYPIYMAVGLFVVLLTEQTGRSRIGRRLRLTSVDEHVAASYGIEVGAHKLGAFFFSGVCAGLAGGMWAVMLGRVSALTFPPSLSILYLAVVLEGGPGAVWGSVIAGAAVGSSILLSNATGSGSALGLLVGPIGILVILSVFPGGLNQIGRNVRSWLRRQRRTSREVNVQ